MDAMKRQFLLLAAFLVISLWSASVFADGVVRDSVGAVSSGRGGTNIAHSDNGAIILNNPAAIVNTPTRSMVDFSVDTILTDLHYSDLNDRGDNAHDNPFPLPQFSIMQRTEDGRFGYGIGFFVPAGFGAVWNLNNVVLGPQRYDTFAAVGKVLPTVAMRVTDRLSVGATLGVAISHEEIEAPLFIQSGPLRGAPTKVDLQGTDTALTWSLGLQYLISDRTTIGVAYQSENRFVARGRGSVTAFLPGGAPPVSSRFDTQIDMAWPRTVGAGITHWLTDNQRISLDVLYYNWSHAYNKIDLAFSNPSNPFFAMFGPKIRDSLALDWKDSVSARVGWEYFFPNSDVLRLGYIHNSQSVPDKTLTPYIPATLEHTVSVGYGHWWGDSTRFDMAYQFAVGPTTRVNQSSIVGGDFNFAKYQVSSHWIYLGLTKFF